MQALILAGGFGTRLRPLTLDTPKPVVSLVNRPIIAYQFDLLRRAGIRDVILSLNYQPDKIQAVIGDGSRYGMKVRYVVEPEPLGSAGAFKFAAEFIKETVVVLNGDNLVNLDVARVAEYHRKHRALATIVLQKIENPLGYGLVKIDEKKRVLRFLEKPNAEELKNIQTRTVNAGTYVFEPEVLDLIPPNENYSFEYGVFPELLKREENFLAYVDDSYWLDVGTPERYLQAHRDILKSRVAGFEIKGSQADSQIAESAEISVDSFVGEACVIEDATKVIGSTLGNSVSAGANSVIENSVVGDGTRIGANTRIDGAIIGRHCHIGDFVTVSSGAILGDASVLTDYGKV